MVRDFANSRPGKTLVARACVQSSAETVIIVCIYAWRSVSVDTDIGYGIVGLGRVRHKKFSDSNILRLRQDLLKSSQA